MTQVTQKGYGAFPHRSEFQGLSLLTNEPASHSYQEHQSRLAGTFTTEFHKFVLSNRNMHVRRFTPSADVNRFRSKSLGSYRFTPFLFEQVYHGFVPGNWLHRNWVAAAVEMPLDRYLSFQPSYIRQDDRYLRSVNFLGLAVIVKTDRLFHRRQESDAANTGQPQEFGVIDRSGQN